jgi:DNA topoisomerase-2
MCCSQPAKIISSNAKADYTQITFSPDLKRFGMATLEEDLCALLRKRVYDMAGAFVSLSFNLTCHMM